MNKKIVNKQEISKAMKSGMEALCGVVEKTLGPGGLPIIIERVGQALDGSPLGPRITKDGVSVSEECSLADPIEDVVMQTVKAICKKTNEDSGDGTTTAIILGNAILMEALKTLENCQNALVTSPQTLKRSIEAAGEKVLKALKASATPIKGYEQVKQVATISANGDKAVGDIIAKAFEEVGANGVVTIDEGASPGLSLGTVKGYRFDRGAQGREAFFNNSSLTRFEGENAAIVMFNGPIRNHTDLVPLLLLIAKVDPQTHKAKGKCPPIVIIADEFSRDAIQFMLMYKNERGVDFCPVVGPNMTNIRTGYYDDLAVFTGGQRLGNGGKDLRSIEAGDIGVAKKVIINKYHTTLYGGKGSEEQILTRVDQLTASKEASNSSYDLQTTNDRIAALTNGIAKIGVCGFTELETKELYDRVEDALNASRAAIEEGVVLGGGVAFLTITHNLFERSKDAGELVLLHALCSPFNQILENAGVSKENWHSLSKRTRESFTRVYDACNHKFVNGFEVGILDPVKVARCAFLNALSVAGLLMTCGGAVVIKR